MDVTCDICWGSFQSMSQPWVTFNTTHSEHCCMILLNNHASCLKKNFSVWKRPGKGKPKEGHLSQMRNFSYYICLSGHWNPIFEKLDFTKNCKNVYKRGINHIFQVQCQWRHTWFLLKVNFLIAGIRELLPPWFSQIFNMKLPEKFLNNFEVFSQHLNFLTLHKLLVDIILLLVIFQPLKLNSTFRMKWLYSFIQ